MTDLVDLTRALETAIGEYFNESDGPGILLGALVVVERRLEHTGSEGGATFQLNLCEPVIGGGHARMVGLARWAEDRLLDPPDAP